MVVVQPPQNISAEYIPFFDVNAIVLLSISSPSDIILFEYILVQLMHDDDQKWTFLGFHCFTIFEF